MIKRFNFNLLFYSLLLSFIMISSRFGYSLTLDDIFNAINQSLTNFLNAIGGYVAGFITGILAVFAILWGFRFLTRLIRAGSR